MTTDGALAVARKKKQTGRPAKPARDTEGWNIKPIIMQMRGSPEYKAWLERLAEFDATSVAEMAERAFAAYARQIGFDEQRPRR